MVHVTAGTKYLLRWRSNPFYWNKSLKEIKKDRYVIESRGRYYTLVEANFTGDFNAVDCICDMNTGDYYPVNTSLLKIY